MRWQIVLGGAWFAAMPFAVLQAPAKWQWLAAAVGLALSLVFTQRGRDEPPIPLGEYP